MRRYNCSAKKYYLNQKFDSVTRLFIIIWKIIFFNLLVGVLSLSDDKNNIFWRKDENFFFFFFLTMAK